jgi:branched-chain amino acid transport system permease protein
MTAADRPRRFLPRGEGLGQALVGAAVICLGLLLACVVLSTVFGIRERVIVTMLISLVAVVGIGTFSGNSGVLSFGHVLFIGLGAYVSGLLTVPTSIKATALPELPSWLANLAWSPELAFVVSIAVVCVFAVVIGIPVVRLPRGTGGIATLGLLILVHATLLGATDFTRGAQTFYAVPPFTTLPIAAFVAVVAIVVARVFRESVFGLGLRASHDDEMASSAMGVDIARMRLVAWTISAGMACASGVLLGHYLGAFSPKEFYFTTTFTLLAMLIVGGMRTVSGAVAGTVLVSLILELARQAESGLDLGPVSIPSITGLTTLALGATLLAVMYTKADGLFGHRELDEMVRTRLTRRRARGDTRA